MTLLRFFLLFFALCNIFLYSKDLNSIVKRGHIIVGMPAADQKPFFYKDKKDGKFKGLDVYIANNIARELGIEARFNRKAKSFDGVVDLVEKGIVDVAISKLSRTLKRAERIRYTTPYVVFRQAFLINRVELAKLGPDDDRSISLLLRNLEAKVGVIKKSSYVTYAKKFFPKADIVEFPTWDGDEDSVVNAVFNGNILLAYRDELEVTKVMNLHKGSALKLKTVLLKDVEDSISMAIKKDNSQLLAYLNQYIATAPYLKDINAKIILEKY